MNLLCLICDEHVITCKYDFTIQLCQLNPNDKVTLLLIALYIKQIMKFINRYFIINYILSR